MTDEKNISRLKSYNWAWMLISRRVYVVNGLIFFTQGFCVSIRGLLRFALLIFLFASLRFSPPPFSPLPLFFRAYDERHAIDRRARAI